MPPLDFSTIDVPCKQRIKVYQDHLQKAWDDLSAARSKTTRCKPALGDKTLLNKLAKLLDEYVLVGVAADLGRCRAMLFNIRPTDSSDLDKYISTQIKYDGAPLSKKTDNKEQADAYNNYFTWFIDPDKVTQQTVEQSGVKAFLARHPMIAHAITKLRDNFVNNIFEVCTRVKSDWDLIGEVFFAGTSMTQLAKISSTGSDFHKGGRQVLILTFDCSDGISRKLVYKPSDVELDYRLVGDTSISKSTNVSYLGNSQSLTELINGFFSADPVKLPTYRILPRNPSSGLNENAGVFPVEKSYGFIEFLTHLPEKESDWKPGQASDWITSNLGDIKMFYRQLGRIMAIASIFSLSDIHKENLIVHKLQPHLIDLEICFTGEVSGLDGTYITDSRIGSLQGSDHMEVKRYRIDDKKGNFRVENQSGDNGAPRSPTINRIRQPSRKQAGTLVLAEPVLYMMTIVTGFLDTMEGLKDHQSDLLAWINSGNIQKAVARFTPYATDEFNNRLRRLYSPLYCSSPVPDLTGPPTSEPYAGWETRAITAYENPASAPEGESKGWPVPRPNYAIQTEAHNFTDYLNCDVPVYYHRLNSCDLIDARGVKVSINKQKPKPNRDTYFPASTYSFVEQQIKDLADDKKYNTRKQTCLEDLRKCLDIKTEVFQSFLSQEIAK